MRSGHAIGEYLAVTVASAICLAAAPVAHAQEPSRPRRWTGATQANGSVFFGNSDQRVFGGRASVGRADSVVQMDVAFQATYGDAQVDDGRREVTKRYWLGTLSLDYRPAAYVSPFVFGTFESSLEKQIRGRHSVGVGAKRTFVRTARSEASLSLALLDERTVPRGTSPGHDPTRLTRWSVRARARHALDDRLRVSHVTFWQPTAGAMSRYLIRSTTEVEYAVTRSVGVSLSFLDNYDSEARTRDARVNNDGQLLFGMGVRW